MIILPVFPIAIGVAVWQVTAQVAGIIPLDGIPILYNICPTIIIGIPAIDAVHPSGPTAAIKFIQVVDAGHVLAAVAAAVLHLKLIGIADTAEQVKNRLAWLKLHGSYRKDTTAGRNNARPLRVFRHAVSYRCVTTDGEGNGVLLGVGVVLIAAVILVLVRQ